MSVSGFSVQLAGKGERVLERALCVFQFCPQRGNIFFQEIFFFHAFLSDEVQFSISSHCAGKAGKSPKLLCFAKRAADCCFSSFLRFVTISAIIFPEVWVKCIIFYFYYMCWFLLVVKKKTKKKRSIEMLSLAACHFSSSLLVIKTHTKPEWKCGIIFVAVVVVKTYWG